MKRSSEFIFLHNPAYYFTQTYRVHIFGLHPVSYHVSVQRCPQLFFSHIYKYLKDVPRHINSISLYHDNLGNIQPTAVVTQINVLCHKPTAQYIVTFVLAQ